MTALKFADIRLPNSGIVVRIPLVKEVFDETVTERTPAGRGLLPDYPVPMSYEEMFTAENDIVLEHALELIAEGCSGGVPCGAGGRPLEAQEESARDSRDYDAVPGPAAPACRMLREQGCLYREWQCADTPR